MEIDVETNMTVSAVFDDTLRQATVTTTAFTLSRGADAIPGAVSLSNEVTAAFTPDKGLALLTPYTATVTTEIESLSGGTLGADYEWVFTTRDGSWGTGSPMEKENPGRMQGPQVAVDPEGTAFAVWEESDGMITRVWSNRYTPVGGWETAEIIDAVSGSSPKVVVDASGNAIALWTEGDGGVRLSLWGNRYTPTGGWGTAELIEMDDAGSAGGVSRPVANPSGNVQVAWVQRENAPTRVWANRYPVGVGWGVAGPIDAITTSGSSPAHLAVDPGGNVMAVWSQSDGMRTNIWANRYTPANGWGVPERIEANNAGPARVPQVALDSSGNAVAVWAHDEGNGDNIWSNRYTPSDGWGIAARVHANDPFPSQWPALAMNPRGEAMAVWIQDEGGGFSRLWWSRYTPNDGWADAEDVGMGSVSPLDFYPQVAIDPSGNALTLWVQERAIWSSRYSPAQGWGSGERMNAGGFNQAVATQSAIDAGGQGMAIWIQRVGLFDLQWNRFE